MIDQDMYLSDGYDRMRDDEATDKEEQISLWYENLSDKEKDEIRYAYEEDLMEHGYSKYTAEESNDGRDERIIEYYKNI